MSEKAIPQTEPASDDVNTTPPNPAMVDGKSGWTMPEPVFRKTSGYLPQGFEKRFSQDEIKDSTEDNDSTVEMPIPEVAGGIEPQPDIEHTDDGFNAEPAAVVAVPQKSSGSKLIFTVVGLILAFALVAVFIAVIYYLFFMQGSDSTF